MQGAHAKLMSVFLGYLLPFPGTVIRFSLTNFFGSRISERKFLMAKRRWND
jgi:hypothetical protein